MKKYPVMCPRCARAGRQAALSTRFSYVVDQTLQVRERWCSECSYRAVFMLTEAAVPDVASGYLLAKRLRAAKAARPSPDPSPA